MTRIDQLEDAVTTALERVSIDLHYYRAGAKAFGKDYGTLREFALNLPLEQLKDNTRACINAFRTNAQLRELIGVKPNEDSEVFARYAGYVLSENYNLRPEQLWQAANPKLQYRAA